MQSVSNDTFGPLIAYLVPGATVLLGFSQFSPALQTWLAATPVNVPTISGFLYLTVAAVAAGMTVNAVRWVLIDALHASTGLEAPSLDFSKLGRNVEAYTLLIEIHYNHFQFYAKHGGRHGRGLRLLPREARRPVAGRLDGPRVRGSGGNLLRHVPRHVAEVLRAHPPAPLRPWGGAIGGEEAPFLRGLLALARPRSRRSTNAARLRPRAVQIVAQLGGRRAAAARARPC